MTEFRKRSSKPYTKKEYGNSGSDRNNEKKSYGSSPRNSDSSFKPKSDSDRKPYVKKDWNNDKPAYSSDRKPYEKKEWSSDKPSYSSDRKPYEKKEWSKDKPAYSTDRKPYEKKEWSSDKPSYSSDRKPYERKEWSKDKPAYSTDRKPYEKKEWSSDKPSYSSDRKPYEKKEWSKDKPAYSSDRKPYEKKEWSSDKPSYSSDRKPYERKEWSKDKPAYSSDRKPYEKKEWSSDKPSYSSDRKPYERKEWNDKPSYSSDRKPYERKTTDSSEYDRKPYDRGARFDEDKSRRPRISEFAKSEFNDDEIVNEKPMTRTSYEDTDLVRLNRYIANCGVCSRREADELIKDGKITVNGVVVTEMGTRIQQKDLVLCDGLKLKSQRKVYIILNKPKDCITTKNDPQGRRTVFDYIQGACEESVDAVGRLDRNTTGVLLFTNDGDLAEKILHPKFHKMKIYHATLDKSLKLEDYQIISEGVELEDGFVEVDDLQYVDDDKSQVGIQIHSGRNHVVKRVFEKYGYQVEKLDRVYFAGLTKKNLSRGKWRFLTKKEIDVLMQGAYE